MSAVFNIANAYQIKESCEKSQATKVINFFLQEQTKSAQELNCAALLMHCKSLIL
jgi:hypothetical protein